MLLQIVANELPHYLRWGEILTRAESFEGPFFVRIDEQREAGGFLLHELGSVEIGARDAVAGWLGSCRATPAEGSRSRWGARGRKMEFDVNYMLILLTLLRCRIFP